MPSRKKTEASVSDLFLVKSDIFRSLPKMRKLYRILFTHISVINAVAREAVVEAGARLQIKCVFYFISIIPLSLENPMFDCLLESSHRDDSNKWSNIGFTEEITQVVSI